MTPDRVREIVAAFGSDPRRWPADEREAAEKMLGRVDPGDLRDAAAVDAALDAWTIADPSPDLAARIVERSRQVAQEGRTGSRVMAWIARLFDMPLAPQAAGLVAALAIGFWIGAAGIGPTEASAQGQEVDVPSMLLGPSIDAEWLS